MKSFFLLAALSVLTTSCVTLDGNLIVSEKMSLKKKGGFLNLGRRNVDIEANQYNAHFKVLGENNFTIELNRGDERIVLPLKSKNDLKVPTYDGEFRVSHNDIDQPYDVKGLILTDVTVSNTQEVVESCTWDTRETRCHIECADVVIKDAQGVEHKENHCRKLCEDFTVSHKGRHEVIFHYRTTHRDLNLDFLKIDTDSSVAHFSGRSTETDKIVEREGICN